MKQEVFISYTWASVSEETKKHEKIVQEIDFMLREDFNILIDRKTILQANIYCFFWK